MRARRSPACSLIYTLRTLFFICFIFLTSFSVPVMAQSAGASGPRLKIAQPEFDFGTVSQGSKVEHAFEVQNVGGAPLTIDRVVPSCGCTASATSKDAVAPGESATIAVTFDSKGFSGKKVKTVRVYTNDLENPTTVLTLRGTVSPDVLVEPKSVFFGDVVLEQANEGQVAQEVTISVQGTSGVRLGDVQTHSNKIKVEQINSTSLKKVLRISLSPEVGLGELRERVIVDLIGAQQRSLNIPIFASVKGPLRLKPASLGFGILEGKQPLVRSVKLENLGKEKLSIGRISSSHPAVTGAIKEIEPGRIYVVNVTVDPTKVSKDLRAAVDIETSEEGQAKLSLSVYGALPPRL